MIQVGNRVPDVELYQMSPSGPGAIKSGDWFDGKRVVLFALPGAFTPTCSEKHLPGFLKLSEAIKAKGVDEIYCLSVNDAFVMKAWLGSYSKGYLINGIADGNADFANLGSDLISTIVDYSAAYSSPTIAVTPGYEYRLVFYFKASGDYGAAVDDILVIHPELGDLDITSNGTTISTAVVYRDVTVATGITLTIDKDGSLIT